MHLRSPSVAGGTSAFLWALGFGIYVWAFLLALGESHAMAFLVGALTFGAVFLFVRTRGVQGHLKKKPKS